MVDQRYKKFFAFLAGFVNGSSVLTLGLFVTHHTGSVTRIGLNIGGMDIPSLTLFGGLLVFYLIGCVIVSMSLKIRLNNWPLIFAGFILIIIGLLSSQEIYRFSFEYYIVGFIVSLVAGIHNTFTTIVGIGKTGHIMGPIVDFTILLVNRDKNCVQPLLFIIFFLLGSMFAFFFKIFLGIRVFVISGMISLLIALTYDFI